jgi:phospholipase C
VGFWSDYQLNNVNDHVNFRQTQTAAGHLPRGQAIEIGFIDGLEGLVEIAVHDGDPVFGGPQNAPSNPPPIQLPGSRLPLKVELVSPRTPTPIRTWNSMDELQVNGMAGFSYYISGPEVVTGGQWRVRVTNNSNDAVAPATVRVSHYADRSDVRTRDLPTRLLNHLLQIALQALVPAAKLEGHSATIRFNPELADLVGDMEAAGLGERRFSLGDLSATGELINVEVRLTSGTELQAAVQKHFDAELARINLLPMSDAVHRQQLQQVRDQVEAQRDAWSVEKVPLTTPVVHATILATTLDLDYSTFLGSVDLGQVKNVSGHLYIAFEPRLAAARVFATSPADFTGLSGVASALGIIPDAGTLITAALTNSIQEVGAVLGRYLGEVLVNLIERDYVFLDVEATDTNWRVRHCRPPAASTTRGGLEDRIPSHPQPNLPTGPVIRIPVPATTTPFQIPDTATLARLDQIQTIIVLMLENRSFDHMLGYLGPKYKGFTSPPQYTSEVAEPYTRAIGMVQAATLTDPVTQIHVSPHHDFQSVRRQIANGAMSGFAREMADRGDPYLAMSYYTATELDVFDKLAQQYCVCTQWFAAHPGPTWPNRFATVTGTIPEVENFESNDPRLGWFSNYTIFDLLSKYGIPWRYFEGDLSFARMFNAFRLDDEHVIPFEDSDEGFAKYVRNVQPTQPRVIFIDPNFVDLPPIATANDDHPPANIANGQRLVNQVVSALKYSPLWANSMLVVTYDEHGGFFDHVAPPGTDLGPADLRGQIPLIHPEGAPHLGVRVPAFVISPWTTPGSVCDRVLDHTSIMKTILVRFRNQIIAFDRSRFGPRVNAAAHLGPALKATSPQTNRNTAPSAVAQSGVLLKRRSTPAGGPERDFHSALLKAFRAGTR